MATNTYVALATVTVGTAGTSFLIMDNIPQTYTDLVFVTSGSSAANNQIRMRFNNNTNAVYSSTVMGGSGTSASSARTNQHISITGIPIDYFSTYTSTSGAGNNITHVMNYSNTNTFKSTLSRANTAQSGVSVAAGLFASTSAITRIDIVSADGTTNISAGTTFSLYGIKNWVPETGSKAVGGEVFYDSTYCYHAFKYAGTFTPTSNISADILVVAGGGGAAGIGGAWSGGGGGGAGGLLAFTSQSLTAATPYTVIVGAGGAPYTTSSANDSKFGSLTTAIGGGYGAEGTVSPTTGGSGGGGGDSSPAGAAGTAGQGYAGGTGVGSNGSSSFAGGGGGGAGGAGANATSSGTSRRGGDGGIGYYDSFTDAIGAAAVALNIGHYVNSHYYFAGGGAGSANSHDPGGTPGVGGYGGGGDGAPEPDGTNPKNGMPSTGGGAGAGRASISGGRGGSGIVVVRYTK